MLLGVPGIATRSKGQFRDVQGRGPRALLASLGRGFGLCGYALVRSLKASRDFLGNVPQCLGND